MKKTHLKHILTILILLIIGGIWYFSYQKLEQQKIANDKIQSLPNFAFYSLQGDTLNSYKLESIPTFIIYFNTHCDFCSFEMEEIVTHQEELSQTQVLFISAEKETTALDSLSTHFSLNYIANMGIYQCPYWRLKNKFGEMGTPTVLLYDADRKLKKRFKGATRVSDLINELQTLNNEQ